MEEPDSGRYMFTVRLRSVDLFLRGICLLRMMASSAVLVVLVGGIQVLATSQEDPEVKATLKMQDMSGLSRSVYNCAVRIDLDIWIDKLAYSVKRKPTESIWISMIGNRHILSCLIGDDYFSIIIGEGDPVTPVANDDSIILQDNRPWTVRLESECFRQVISTFAAISDEVTVRVDPDSLSFSAGDDNNTLTFSPPEAVCSIIRPQTLQTFRVSLWNSECILGVASWLSKRVFLNPVTQQNRVRYMQFFFYADANNSFIFTMVPQESY